MTIDEDVKVKLNTEIGKAHYIFDRYEALSTFALVYHESDISLEILGSYVRISDKLVRISENYHFIIFNFTTQDDAYQASRNLLKKLDKHFDSARSCIAIDAPSKADSTHMVLNKLFQIIEKTKESSISRIEYSDILDNTF